MKPFDRSHCRLARLALVFCMVFAAGSVVSAEELPLVKPESVGMKSGDLAAIGRIVDDAVKAQKTAGAVVVVLRRGKVVHFSAHGHQEIAADKPMTRDSVFRIYSMTKPITTVAALILWERNRFKLDDPVAKYLPEFKGVTVYVEGEGVAAKYVAPDREMSVRDLMRHTSGLTSGSGKTPVDRRYRELWKADRTQSLEEHVRELARVPLKYQPGTRFEYGLSTNVLGRLVEVWSKRTLDEFFASEIFEPLDMIDTGFHVRAENLGRFTAGYGPASGGGLMAIDEPATSRYRKRPALLSGGGGLVSTARDYSRFCQMLLGGGKLGDVRLLKTETVGMMTENQMPVSALPIVHSFPRIGWGFGLGFAVRVAKSDDSPDSPVGECRWGGAASTHFWLSPQDDLGVIVMQQHRPFIRMLETQIKPVVYNAITERR